MRWQKPTRRAASEGMRGSQLAFAVRERNGRWRKALASARDCVLIVEVIDV